MLPTKFADLTKHFVKLVKVVCYFDQTEWLIVLTNLVLYFWPIDLFT